MTGICPWFTLEAILLRIAVCEQAGPAASYPERNRWPWDNHGRRERFLFDVLEEILRIPVEFEVPHFKEWIIAVRPGPWSGRTGCRGALAASASGITCTSGVHLGKLPRSMASNKSRWLLSRSLGYDTANFVIREVLYALLRLECELESEPFIARLDETVGMGAEDVHMTKLLPERPGRS